MPNNLVTTQEIAREAMPILSDNLVMPQLVYQDLSSDYAKRGDTVKVRRPAKFVSNTFDGTIKLQDIDEGEVLVKLSTLHEVSFSLTDTELALELSEISARLIQPAVVALAERINSDGLAMYAGVPYFVGEAGVTPGQITTTGTKKTGLEAFAQARRALNVQRAPIDRRYGIWNPDADANFATVPSLVNAEKAGTTEALRNGAIGRVFGIDNYMSQAVVQHTAGGYAAASGVTVATAASKGATSIDLTATSGSGKLVAGDLLTIAGVQYTVTADTADAASNAISGIAIYPALAADVASGATVTLIKSHAANLVFHPRAFAWVSRPLEAPAGTDSYTTTLNGLSLRVTRQYDITHKMTIVSLDILGNYAMLYPELAVRVLG